MSYLSKKRGRKQKESQSLGNNTINLIESLAITTNSLIKVDCSFCKSIITKQPKFICAVCKDNPVFCLNCLIAKKGADKMPHRHDYYPIDKMAYPFFTSDWSAQDELHLLSGIEKFGLDNWEDIAKQISDKGKMECEAHYYSFYYKSEKDTQPNKSELIIRGVNYDNDYEYEYDYDSDINQDNEEKEKELKDKIKKTQGKIPEFTSANTHTLNRSRSLIKNRNKKEQKVITSASEILGYWPKREEFDIEYQNDAELEVSELEFNDDDTPEMRELKMNILKIYNSQLDERFKRKKFVIERNLFDVKKQISFERRLSKEDRDIYNCLKPFARWIQTEQFHELFDGFVLEKNVRLRLNQLKYYKDLGCQTYDDIQALIDKEAKKDKGNSNKDNDSHHDNANGNGVGDRIKKFLRNFSHDNTYETEKDFIKSIGIPKTVYKEIKKNIMKDVLNEKSSKGKIFLFNCR